MRRLSSSDDLKRFSERILRMNTTRRCLPYNREGFLNRKTSQMSFLAWGVKVGRVPTLHKPSIAERRSEDVRGTGRSAAMTLTQKTPGGRIFTPSPDILTVRYPHPRPR